MTPLDSKRCFIVPIGTPENCRAYLGSLGNVSKMTKLDWALEHALAGIRVFPLHGIRDGRCTCNNSACEHPGKHPRVSGWQNAATTDVDEIRKYWSKWPDSNIGGLTGESFVVLDVDKRNGGLSSLECAIQEFGELRQGPVVQTGGGGKHFYFATPQERTKSLSGIHYQFPGLDFKSIGGYVVLPGSDHASGRGYEWELDSSLAEMTLPKLPDWILDRVRVTNFTQSGYSSKGKIPEGKRNAHLTSLAGTMHRKGMDPTAIVVGLKAENQKSCTVPLPDSEVENIVQSVIRYPRPGDTSSHPDLEERPKREPNLRVTEHPGAMDDAALIGPLGEFIRIVKPQSEASVPALVIQFLTFFGNFCGRGAWYQVESDCHFPNLFVCVVGSTSKARKGTSYGRVKRVFELADLKFVQGQLKGGLSTGEGLIHHVRDPRYVIDKEGAETVEDAGVKDKRALIFESEFARILKVMNRDINTLGPVLRDAWDRGELRTLTKTSAEVATGAHISLIAHITAEELIKDFSAIEQANGFGNRIIWIWSERSQLLPHGGDLSDAALDSVAESIRIAATFAEQAGRVEMELEADQAWVALYDELSEGEVGMYGALLSRSEAQVIRLALIYALLECCQDIKLRHIEAAVAVWEYCERSVLFIWQNAPGNSLASKILTFLKEGGPKTRSELSAFLGRNTKKVRIDEALGILEANLLAHRNEEPTGGRSAERWAAC